MSRSYLCAMVGIISASVQTASFTVRNVMDGTHRPYCRTRFLSSTMTETIFATEETATTQVDMNTYNLLLEEAAMEWTANLVPKSPMMDEGVYLGARDHKNIYADTLRFQLTRRASPEGGLGMELLEIAGGRQDGLGITIITGLVTGGNAEGSGILPGDSIVSIEARISNGNKVQPVSLECLGYDATVEAILGLPKDWEVLDLQVKRLRRKPKVHVTLQYPPDMMEPDETMELFAGENLRRAMLTRGVKLNDALSRRFDSGGTGDCGAEGTCATCVVNVQEGGHLLNKMNIQEKQILQKNPRWRLACKAIVGYGGQEGSMKIQVNPRQW